MLGLFFDNTSGGVKTSFGNEFGNIELDASLDEAPEFSAEATSNPVEEGAPITDHIIEQSDKLRIRGFVSDHPIVSNSFAQISRTQDVFDMLYQLIKQKQLVTVYTKFKIYSDMVLTNVSPGRDASTGQAIEFTAEFIHIRKVATQTVEVPNGISKKETAKTPASVVKKSQPTKDAGKKQAEVIASDKPIAKKMSSFAFRATQ